MTRVEQIIEAIIEREGGFNDRPQDKGGPTCWGIAKKFHPEAWVNGPPTKDVARAIYRDRYVKPFAAILDPALQEQLIDIGVNSGPPMATTLLQRCLGVKEDGILGPKTLGVANSENAKDLNNKLMCERLRMFGRILQRDKTQAIFIAGWINRATEFVQA